MPRKNKEDDKAYQKRWYEANKPRILEMRRAYAKANKDRLAVERRGRYHKKYRDRKLAKVYGVSVEEAKRLLAIADCELCGNAEATDTDHCHDTGKVRGRLCTNCNNGLGRFMDDPALLRKAANYLEGKAHENV